MHFERLPLTSPFRQMAMYFALICFLGGWIFAFIALFDSNLLLYQKVLAFTLLGPLFGGAVVWWTLTIAVRVEIDRQSVEVSLWPISKTVIDRRNIQSIAVVTVDPLNEYGGWGVKGSRKDRLYGMSGTTAIRIVYDVEKQLTILTEHARDIEHVLSNGRP